VTLTLPLTSEEQAKLEQKASAQGLSLDAFVRSVLAQAAASPDASSDQRQKKPLPLPKWPGRAIGSLRREDIYEDVR